MRAPQHAGIALFRKSLRRGTYGTRPPRRLGNHSKIREIQHARPLRHPQLRWSRRRGPARHRRKPLHPDIRVLHHDFVQHRRHIVRLVSDITHEMRYAFSPAPPPALPASPKTTFHCTNRAGGLVTASPAPSWYGPDPALQFFSGLDVFPDRT